MSSPQFIKPYPNGYIDGEAGNTPVTAEILNTNYDGFLLALNEFLPELQGMVEANPSEAATAGNLTKLKVGNSIYLIPSGGSGGSTVEWEQIQLTGTKIATITIDNVPVDVYAPSGGGSGDEVSWTQTIGSGTKIGTITINGTPTDVYAPTPIDVEANPSGSATAGDLTKLKVGSSIYSIPSGGSGGASDLSDLGDVTITNVQNGQILKWNSTTSKWENANESGGGGTTVVANPSGQATANLEKLQVGNDIYSIPSGGTGGSWTDVTGTLTAGQTSITLSHGSITEDGTFDFYTSIFGVNPTAVSVSTGSVTLTFEAQQTDMKVKVRVTNEDGPYIFKQYLQVGSTAGAYIDTGYTFTSDDEFEVKCQYYDTPTSDTYIFGAWQSYKDTFIGYKYGGGGINYYVGGSGAVVTYDTNVHIYKATQSDILLDGTSIGQSPNWNMMPSVACGLFKDPNHNATNNARIYYAKIWSDGTLVRDFVPAVRKADNIIGMYDRVNDVFYTNDGTGSFTTD